MAGEAAKVSYTDPTAQIMQSLMALGGTANSSSTSSTIDPTAAAGLQQVLNQQLGQITPEGMQSLITSIFKEGASQVPGIASAYGQAVGARARGNSPVQLALGDLMTKLSAEGTRQILGAQNNAANTAGKLADVTRQTTTSATSKPKASAMTLAPFILSNLGGLKKLKDYLPGSSDGSGGQSVFGAGMNQSGQLQPNAFGISNGSYGGSSFSLADGSAGDLFSSAAGDAATSGLDFSGVNTDAITSGLGDSFGGFIDNGEGVADFAGGLMFADGGLIDKTKMILRANPAAEAAFATDAPIKSETKNAPSAGDEKEGGKKDATEKEDLTGRSGLGVRMMRYIKGIPDPKGYADGGVVRGYANGGKTQKPGDISADFASGGTNYTPDLIKGLLSGSNIRGYDVLGDIVPELFSHALNDEYKDPERKKPLTPTAAENRAAMGEINNQRGEGSSAVGAGTTNGPVGTPAENQAAMLGMVTMGLSQIGIPSAITNAALNSMGLQVSSMNPFSQLISFISNTVGGANNNSIDGLPGTMSSQDDDGVSSSNTGMTTGDMGDEGGNIGGLSGDSVGSTGADGTGDSGGVGGGGGAASSGVGSSSGDGPGYKQGGEINGPGTGTSDSIPIHVSDGEYIFPKDSVDFFGVEFLDALKNATHTPVAQRGAR